VEFGRDLERGVRDNLLPLALTGAGLAWLLASVEGDRAVEVWRGQGRGWAGHAP
jgi:hypothetical protein